MALLLLPPLNQDSCLKGIIDQGFWKLFIPRAYDIVARMENAIEGANPGVDDPAHGGMLFSPTTGRPYTGGVNGVSPSSFGKFTDMVASTGYTDGLTDGTLTSASTLVFCIPIYSGIIGVLMPDKKMIPLSLMPLELEFTMNPYALYCAGSG